MAEKSLEDPDNQDGKKETPEDERNSYRGWDPVAEGNEDDVGTHTCDRQKPKMTSDGRNWTGNRQQLKRMLRRLLVACSWGQLMRGYWGGEDGMIGDCSAPRVIRLWHHRSLLPKLILLYINKYIALCKYLCVLQYFTLYIRHFLSTSSKHRIRFYKIKK